MNFIAVETYKELSQKAGLLIAAQILQKPDCVLGLATGSSPVGAYKKLIEMNQKGEIDFADVTTVNLDEYVGLTGEHDQSYRYFMNTNLFDHVKIDKENTHVPCGTAADTKAEGEAYDQMIEALGGIDLQLLGIGIDGHIGFNEPDSVFTAATHEVVLDESTIDANARFFANREDVPKKAITMGMKSIMQAKKILMIANGAAKKDVLLKALYGPIDPQVPASILQLHPNVTVIFSEK